MPLEASITPYPLSRNNSAVRLGALNRSPEEEVSAARDDWSWSDAHADSQPNLSKRLNGSVFSLDDPSGAAVLNDVPPQ